jgi:ABC-type multidrug transport system permease subunit
MWATVGGGESFVCGLVVQDVSPEANDMAGIITDMVSTTNFTWFSVEEYDLATADNLWRSGDLIAYILIPAGFGANISSGQQASVTLYISNLNDDVVKNYVHRIEAAVLLYNQGATSPDFDQEDAQIALDETLSLPTTPSNTSYTAAIAIILSMIACTLTSQAMLTATEFETKAVHDTMSSPTPRIAILIGRTIAAIPRSFLSVIIAAPVIILVMGTLPVGNLLVLFAIMLVSVLALMPIGELIGMLTRNREQALLFSVLLTVVGFLAGGGLAPIGLTPANYRLVAQLIPITHTLTLWARVYFQDTVSGLTGGFLFLFATWIILSAVVTILMNREVERA